MKNPEQSHKDETAPEEQKEEAIESPGEQPKTIEPVDSLGGTGKEKGEPKIEKPDDKEEKLKVLRERVRLTPDVLGTHRQGFQRVQRRLEELRQDLSERRAEQSKSNWQVFTDLWKSGQDVSRLTLLEEFLFNPNALRQRYRAEKDFQKNLESHWQKPKKRKQEDE